MEIIIVSAPHEVPMHFTGRVDYYYDIARYEEGIYPPDCKEYYFQGRLHKEDGPAVIYLSGEKRWFLFGRRKTAEEIFDLLEDEDKEKAIWNLDQWR